MQHNTYNMRKELLDLEKKAALLEPGVADRRALREKVVNYTEKFIDEIKEGKAYFPKGESRNILATNLGKERATISEIINYLDEELDKDGINPASGGHLGYIPGGGIYASSLGDYWAAITNRYAGVFFANPGAVRIENKLIRWVCELIGYPETAHGNLTSGGSMANLIGIVTAREGKKIRGRDVEKCVIYLSKQSHLSISKSIQVAGLSEAVIRYVDMNEDYRIDAEKFSDQVKKDKTAGLNPFLLVASAGTTDLGAVDPLEDLADISRQEGIWLHIDAAYGGFFILTKEGKKKFKGIEKSDSLAIDPHKGLFLPYGLGVCIVRERKVMQDAFTFDATYLQDTKTANEEINPMDVSPEMTKHFRGLRMWIPLVLYGIEPFRAALEEKLLLTKYFYEKIKNEPNFEVGPFPQLSVVTFRYVHKDPSKSDAFNKRIVEEVHRDGRVFFSSTTINGKFILRLAILSFRTHLSTIDLTMDILREKVADIKLQNGYS